MSCETETGPIRYIADPIAAGTTAALTLYLNDEAGAALALVDLASLELTLVDQSTGFVVNGRDAQNVKNANGGVVEEVTVDGVARLRLRMLLSVDDTEIQVAGRTVESHAALFVWTYDTAHVGKILVVFSVVSTEEAMGVGPGSLPAGAPATVEYLVGALSGGLSAERLVTDTASITWDLSTPGQAKANAIGGGVASYNGRTGAVVPVAGDYATADITGLVADLAAKATTASVTAEAVTRAAADVTLQANITTEAGTRAAADAALQPLAANLTAFSGLTGAADRGFYFTALGALALYNLTTFGRTLGALADYAALRTGAGLVIGTDVAAQADSRFPTANEKAALAGTGTPSGTDKFVNNSDSRMTDSRAPSGSAGGSLGGTFPNPSVTKINETGGPTALTIGAIADGQHVKRSGSTLVGAATWTTLIRSTDQAVTSSTVLVDDDTLFFTANASTKYLIRGSLLYETAGTAPNYKPQFTFGGTVTSARTERWMIVPAGTAYANIAIDTALNSSYAVVGNTTGTGKFKYEIMLVVGASGGTFKVQFAQNTSSANATTHRIGSYLEYLPF